MALPKTSTSNLRKGISLIEVIIALGLIGLIGSGIGNTHINEYQQYSFSDERNAFVNALQKARSRAMQNICLGPECTKGLPHGIYLEDNVYVIFQGLVYDPDDPQNETMHFHTKTKVIGPTYIIFSPLSGAGSTTPLHMWDIVFIHDSMTATTTINSEGLITWTH